MFAIYWSDYSTILSMLHAVVGKRNVIDHLRLTIS